ncbi:MAG: c-type cytochrome [Chloroflexota bacterium]|nr:c-type cytochrome [Chloroflexota bacterium]
MLQRLLIDKMENRIIVGTIAFLGIMVLVGWLAINEGGRMQAFERQYLARSIERGAALFNSNCSSCHATDGLGLAGRAPALNSPYLFGHNFLASIDRELVTLGQELTRTDLSAERAVEITTRVTELQSERASIVQALQPAVTKGYDPETPSRLARLGWGGTLNSFVYTTLVHGRPTSGLYWPTGQGMAAWSQTAGGPLRGDQLEDLTNYILNYDKGDGWTTDDANAVVQYPINPIDSALAGPADDTPRVGTDVAAIETELVNITRDPVNGQALYNGGVYACAGCHSNAAVAPATGQTWTAAQNERLQAPENAGQTPEQYLIMSIINPNHYIVPGYPAGVMPQNFGERMTHQDLGDILAYLESYDSGVGAQASADGG